MQFVGSAVVEVEVVDHLELLVLVVAHGLQRVLSLGKVHIMTLQGQPSKTHG